MLPALADVVQYSACRFCGWRANTQDLGMPNACPDCRKPVLTVLKGTIAEVAARLEHFPDGDHSGMPR